MEKRIKEGNHKGIFEGNYDEPDSNNTIDIEIEGKIPVVPLHCSNIA